jgi:hypothetical protein
MHGIIGLVTSVAAFIGISVALLGKDMSLQMIGRTLCWDLSFNAYLIF